MGKYILHFSVAQLIIKNDSITNCYIKYISFKIYTVILLQENSFRRKKNNFRNEQTFVILHKDINDILSFILKSHCLIYILFCKLLTFRFALDVDTTMNTRKWNVEDAGRKDQMVRFIMPVY